MAASNNRHTRRKQRRRRKLRKRMNDKDKRKEYAESVAGKQGTIMCGRKMRYPSRERAMAAGLAKYGIVMRAYRCPICLGWHITHLP